MEAFSPLVHRSFLPPYTKQLCLSFSMKFYTLISLAATLLSATVADSSPGTLPEALFRFQLFVLSFLSAFRLMLIIVTWS